MAKLDLGADCAPRTTESHYYDRPEAQTMPVKTQAAKGEAEVGLANAKLNNYQQLGKTQTYG